MTPKPQWEIDYLEKFDWVNCDYFIPADDTTRPCYRCGVITQFCGNCHRDHHIVDKNIAIIEFIRSQIEKSYQQGVEDMRRKCVGIVKEKSDSVGECIEEIENYKSN